MLLCATMIATIGCSTSRAMEPETSDVNFFDNKVMAHALGGYKGNKYNNHELALKQSIENDYKFIEVDLILTKDEKLVCSHGWSKQTYLDTGVEYNKKNPVMTYEQFMSTKIQGKYDTMDVSKFVEYVKEYDDIVWELDLRTLDYNASVKTATAIVKAFDNESEYLDRLLIQVGSKDMYNGIDSVYKFKHYQYFISKANIEQLSYVTSYARANGIESYAINKDYVTQEIMDELHKWGKKVLVHTVDSVEEAQKFLDMGADTICTNFVLPSEVK